ncbi:hypothetical protein ABTF84_17470 [Acinetobacter baumannii]
MNKTKGCLIANFATVPYWYAYWNMYQQPKVKPVLSAGIEYWWSNANQAKKVAQYLHQQ